MSATFVGLDGIKAAIAEVRDDRKSTNWALLSYEGENTNNVVLVGKGEAGTNELIDHLQDDMVGYGIVRLVERRDDSDTIKFVFVKWIGEGIHRMLRARLGTHSGAIKEVLSPYHVSVEATTKDEINEDIIWSHVKKASGTATYVIDKPGSAPSHSSASHAPKSPQAGVKNPQFVNAGVNKQSGGVNFKKKKKKKKKKKDVRSDATGTNWVLASYDAPNSNNVILLASGEGGSAELLGHLKDDIVAYGLVRQSERFDDSTRTMFAFINWNGENIHRMLRAKLSTHSGAIKELFSPYHVSINAEKDSEISEDSITTTIRETMGTASKVRN
eukprot:Phypoly_transcript_12368.p1 GENE.Phypoly_transcript_12368~~Phypoly_transcript_12368.p1  ORF type:complete len:329 (+),score=68.40 Phypoly_transcript_12368:111-1097(+)